MRRSVLAALLISVLLLASCGSGDEGRFETLRAEALSGAVSAAAEITVLDAEAAETYTIEYTETADGCTMAVTAPELLSGVTAHVAAGETTLEYDGLILPAPLDDPRRAPLMALPVIMNAIRHSHLDLVWREGDTLCAQLIDTDDEALRLYFSEEGAPIGAEIILDGSAALRCELTKWSVTTHESNDPDVGGDQSQHPGA